MPWRRFSITNYGVPWRIQSSTAVVLTPRYVVGLLAFLICVDMTQILGVLCYQLFLGTYFPWHLYPLMLNRAVELLALLCSDGHVPSVYSVAQIFLSVLSMVICIQKQPCGKFNCVAALVLYGVLLTYQIFVAVMVIKISSIPIVGDDGGSGTATWLQDFEGQRPMSGMSPSSSMRSRMLAENEENGTILKDYDDVIIAVEQPDGEKYAIARLCKDVFIVPKLDSLEGSSQSLDEDECASCKDEDKVLKFENDEPPNTYKIKQFSHGEQLEGVETSTINFSAGSKREALVLNDMKTKVGGASNKENIDSSLVENSLSTSLELKKDEQELVENIFLTNVTNEIVSLMEEGVAQEMSGKDHEGQRKTMKDQ